jgi:hypothetical protein
MKKTTAVFGSGLLAILTVGALAGSAISGVNGPGVDFKAAYPADDACFQLSGSSYAGITNTCSTARLIVATLPITNEGWHPTSVSLFGSNSWCQTVSTNGVGNGAHVGPATWTTAGPQTWQTLNTGDRYVWSWSPLAFRCVLEPGGVIGSFSAQ